MGEEIETARKAALEGGREALRYYRKLRPRDVIKKGERNVATAADLAAERRIRAVLRKQFPDHPVIGEELGGGEPGSAKGAQAIFWAVDPIDGTNNFILGLDLFSVCVAALREGDAIAAAVYLPVQKRMYSAEKGKGAFCNGKRIRVSRESLLENSIVLCSMDITALRQSAEYDTRVLREMLLKTRGIRLFNSWALELCLVAEGTAQGAFSSFTNLWDFSAAGLILQEAGGVLTNHEGVSWKRYLSQENRRTRLVAGNGKIHKTLLAAIQKARQGDSA